MATPYQDFDALDDASESSGTLRLGGRDWKIRHRDDVPFEIVKRLMGQEEIDPNADPATLARQAREVVMQTGPFFAATIVREEVPEFMELLEAEDSPLTIGKLRPVMEYIAGVVFSEEGDERPTKPSSPKLPGRSTTGNTSKAASSSRGTPRKASVG